MSVPNPLGRAASSLTNEGAAQRKGLRERGCGRGHAGLECAAAGVPDR